MVAKANKLEHVKRGLTRLKTRGAPYGLISLSFLNPLATAEIKLHRSLSCYGLRPLPRVLILLINIPLWFRWIFYLSWRYAYRTLQVFGNEVEASHGISKARQFCHCLWLAQVHCIPPNAFYRFRLYLNPQLKSHWHYIYHSELPEYHLSRDQSGSAAQREQLADKDQFARLMRQAGVIAADGRLLAAGTCFDELQLSPECRYFLKPVRGSRSVGVFGLDTDHCNSPTVYNLANKKLNSEDVIGYINSQFAAEPYLLQPRYINHPDVDALFDHSDEAVTLRIITWRCGSHIDIYCAYLEIPAVSSKGKSMYVPVQVDNGSGIALVPSLRRLAIRDKAMLNSISSRLLDFIVPDYQQCVANNKLAHAQFDDVYAIAWDNVITADGPILLEGNSNWNIELPQIFCGGVLRHSPEQQGVAGSQCLA